MARPDLQNLFLRCKPCGSCFQSSPGEPDRKRGCPTCGIYSLIGEGLDELTFEQYRDQVLDELSMI